MPIMTNRIIFKLFLIVIIFAGNCTYAGAEVSPKKSNIHIFSRNDVHGHLLEDSSAQRLGGEARTKTKITQLREAFGQENTALVDGGDFAEGTRFNGLDAGVDILKLMDHLGYDVAVIGNHDWLNGPDNLLNSIQRANPKMALVSSNLSADHYSRKSEFDEKIIPYVIREIGGHKVAFIGISTYENVYFRFFDPVQVLDPQPIVKALAKKLREEADLVVAISHNSVSTNKTYLQAIPELDLIVGAHDHRKLTQPIQVERYGKGPSWIVEAGQWGRYLADVEVTFVPRANENKDSKLKDTGVREDAVFVNYKLHQIDRTIPEDPETLEKVLSLQKRIVEELGRPYFDEVVAESQVDVERQTVESPMTNLATDAFLSLTGADFAVDSAKFIYGSIFTGPLTESHFFDIYPAVLDPQTKKTWTVKTFSIKGNTLSWLLYLVHVTAIGSRNSYLSSAGLEYVYDPLLLFGHKNNSPFLEPSPFGAISTKDLLMAGFMGSTFAAVPDGLGTRTISVIQDIKIKGEPLDPEKMYTAAVSQGVIDSIEYANSYIGKLPFVSYYLTIPFTDFRDTGIECWQALMNYTRSISPLTPENMPRGGRIRSLQPDLGIFSADIQWTPLKNTPDGIFARLGAKIANYGVKPTSLGATAHVYYNRNKADASIDPDWVELDSAQVIPVLNSGESQLFEWLAVVPPVGEFYPVTIIIEDTVNDMNPTHKDATRWFKAP